MLSAAYMQYTCIHCPVSSASLCCFHCPLYCLRNSFHSIHYTMLNLKTKASIISSIFHERPHQLKIREGWTLRQHNLFSFFACRIEMGCIGHVLASFLDPIILIKNRVISLWWVNSLLPAMVCWVVRVLDPLLCLSDVCSAWYCCLLQPLQPATEHLVRPTSHLAWPSILGMPILL